MNKDLILYPEVLAAVIKNNEEDVFCLWLLSKKIDVNNTGLIDVKEIINFGKLSLGINSNYIYTKITKGIDKYWRKPHGKNRHKKIGLLSIDKIVNRLEPEITRSRPVVINVKNLQSNGLNSKYIRQLFVSIVAGRYDDNRPISIASLIHNTGLNRSCLFDIIKNSPYLKIVNNYSVISVDYNKNNLNSVMQNSDCPWSYRIVENDGIYKLLKQQPNSYLLNDFHRLPYCKRPKSLKANDRKIIDLLSEKRYNVSNNNKYLGSDILLSFSS